MMLRHSKPLKPLRRHHSLRRRQQASAQPTTGPRAQVHLTFSIQRKLNFGESLRVAGAADALGAWDPDRAIRLEWSDGDVWRGEACIDAGSEHAFKLVTDRGEGGLAWEDGPDHRFVAGVDGSAMQVLADERSVSVLALGESTNEACVAYYSGGTPADGGGNFYASHDRWAGGDVPIMMSNDHATEVANGKWDATGLSGPAAALVTGDEQAKNWRSKLELVASLLLTAGAEADTARADFQEALALSAVYLQWVSTGTVRCVEDGGHQRPNSIALKSRDIFLALERLMISDGHAPSSSVLIARRLQPWLPSFAAAFTVSVPMTRIRDIAHRNDIPQDLKKEIKYTLQNKLHRSAGPEDLVATERILTRLLADEHAYSGDFVHEFKTFHAELKEFFNAGGVFETVGNVDAALRSADPETNAPILDALWAARDALEWHDGAGGGEDRSKCAELLRASTAVRGALATLLSEPVPTTEGLDHRPHSEDKEGQAAYASLEAPIELRQRLRWAEQGLERYAFVLLARIQAGFESMGGVDTAAAADGGWLLGEMAEAAALALRHVELSGYEQAESACAANELRAWAAAGGAHGGDDQIASALRLRAAVERAQRLVDAHTRAVLAHVGPAAITLGDALGVSEPTSRVFAEADVRAGVPFQLSRVLQLLHQATIVAVGGDGFEVIVPGMACGTVGQVAELTPAALSGAAGEVLLVGSVTGDEELAGASVRGLVLRQQLPHLSHLAIQARQAGVVLVSATSAAVADAAAALIGHEATLDASSHGTRLSEGAEAGDGSTAASASKPSTDAEALAIAVTRAEELVAVPLEAATAATAGAKAAACAELLRLAEADSAPFAAAPGVVLPFGCMELAVGADELAALLAPLETAGAGSAALDEACAAARNGIAAAAEKLPAQVLDEALAAFPPGTRLIARSSASVEDLEGLSAAGLYDSVYDIEPGSTDALAKAIAEVWASLYTRRAVLARRVAGLSQAEACMAVLIQPLLPAELSFVLHTRDPLGGEAAAETICAEIAAGLGETLASAANGSAWRLTIAKGGDGEVQTLSFANFGAALRIHGEQGVVSETVDYAEEALTASAEARAELGASLAAAGAALEAHFKVAQDVEGAVVDGRVFVVQSRPQP
mmetsp:Transcript_4360/g.15113  ORF Transcript_4360/g.15113 Transcript_4360/m.15113 type:complete len:1131 (+) Transcript_4360:97-3489(+)